MSFGYGIMDIVSAGKLAYDIWKECEAAPDDYKEVGELCREIDVAINSCSPNDPHSILRVQHAESLARLAASCRSTLKRLENLLHGYQDMSGIQGVGKRLGFTMSKSERENIRRNLHEHLSAISTFLQGVQVTTFGLTVRLLFKILEERVGSTNEEEIRSIVDNPEKLQDLFKEVRSENQDLNTELDKDKDLIRDKLKETAKKGGEATPLSETATSGDSETTITVADVQSAVATGPARPSSGLYDPWAIDWYANGGWRYMTPVSTVLAMMRVTLPDEVMRYSEDEEWLCKLPEGWSLIRTMITRNGKKEEAFYYSFNNLSALPGNRPSTTRAYFLTAPFSYDGMLRDSSTFEFQTEAIGRPFPKFQHIFQPGNMVMGCVGYHLNWLPYDLGDPFSRTLASIQIGTSGIQSFYSDEKIEEGLPDGWKWDSWKEGTQRNVYTDTKTKTESTVHPARFYSSTDKISHVLPTGWDRRLDSWGNLFFVDKHTHRATREDPRFNNKIDQQTGLPKGWFEIRDHKGEQYFYTKTGQMIFGTYEPAAMNSKSLKHKFPLSDVPKDKDDPSTLVSITLPLAKRIAEAREKEATAAAALAATQSAQTLSPATEEEKKGYHEVFRSIEKSDPYGLRISLIEALEHTKNFDVPQNTVGKILDRHDRNKDRRWNAVEYADALHEIKFELEKRLKERPLRPRSAADEQKYTAMFNDVKSPESDVMRTAEIRAVCQEFDLPDEFLRRIFVRADANRDRRWDIDEFIPAMHRVMHEVETRDELRKFAPVTAKAAGLPTSITEPEITDIATKPPMSSTADKAETPTSTTVPEGRQMTTTPPITSTRLTKDSSVPLQTSQAQTASLQSESLTLPPPEELEPASENLHHKNPTVDKESSPSTGLQNASTTTPLHGSATASTSTTVSEVWEATLQDESICTKEDSFETAPPDGPVAPFSAVDLGVEDLMAGESNIKEQ